MEENTEEKTPTGVIAFGVLHIIYSSFFLLITLTNFLMMGGMIALLMTTIMDEGTGGVWIAILVWVFTTIITVTVSILGILGSIGAFMGKQKARKLLVVLGTILSIIAAIQSIITLIMTISGFNILMLIFLIITLAFLVYFILLTRYFKKPEVKEWFEKKEAQNKNNSETPTEN